MKPVQVVEVPYELTTEEVALLNEIEALKRDYERQAKPFIDRLVAIRGSRPPKYVIIPADHEGNKQ